MSTHTHTHNKAHLHLWNTELFPLKSYCFQKLLVPHPAKTSLRSASQQLPASHWERFVEALFFLLLLIYQTHLLILVFAVLFIHKTFSLLKCFAFHFHHVNVSLCFPSFLRPAWLLFIISRLIISNLNIHTQWILCLRGASQSGQTWARRPSSPWREGLNRAWNEIFVSLCHFFIL